MKIIFCWRNDTLHLIKKLLLFADKLEEYVIALPWFEKIYTKGKKYKHSVLISRSKTEYKR